MRVLIVRVGAMGDVLHGLAAVAALRVARPDWRIDWAVEPRWGDLLEAGGAGTVVDEVIPVRTGLWKRGPVWATVRDVLKLRRRLRAGRYDVCVDLQGSIRSGVIGWMAGAGRFAGEAAPREGLARWLYGVRVASRAAHVIDRGCDLLGAAVGVELAARGEDRARAIPADDEAEEWAVRLLDREFPGGCAGRVVVLAPGAGWGAKEWGAGRFRELGERLAGAGFCVVVNEGSSGGRDGGEIRRGLPSGRAAEEESATARSRFPSGMTNKGARANATATANSTARSESPSGMTIEEGTAEGIVRVECTIAQLAALLRRASLAVGGDTGPMHLADALGVPVVALFGPTDPARTGPYAGGGEDGAGRARVLRHPESRTDHRRHAGTEAGLRQIPVDAVFGAAMELLALRTDGAGTGRDVAAASVGGDGP